MRYSIRHHLGCGVRLLHPVCLLHADVPPPIFVALTEMFSALRATIWTYIFAVVDVFAKASHRVVPHEVVPPRSPFCVSSAVATSAWHLVRNEIARMLIVLCPSLVKHIVSQFDPSMGKDIVGRKAFLVRYCIRRWSFPRKVHSSKGRVEWRFDRNRLGFSRQFSSRCWVHQERTDHFEASSGADHPP